MKMNFQKIGWGLVNVSGLGSFSLVDLDILATIIHQESKSNVMNFTLNHSSAYLDAA